MSVVSNKYRGTKEYALVHAELVRVDLPRFGGHVRAFAGG